MADELTVWTYAGSEEALLKWTRDGSTVTVTDGGDNSYTYTIPDTQHFTGMTLIKDGSPVDWPENTAYNIKGSDNVTLSGTIVTATTKSFTLNIYTVVDGVKTLYYTCISSNVNYDYKIIIVGIDDNNSNQIDIGMFEASTITNPISSEFGKNIDITGTEWTLDISPVGTVIADEPTGKEYGYEVDNNTVDITITMISLKSTFTLYHDSTD